MSNSNTVQIRKALSFATLADLSATETAGLQTGCVAFVEDQAQNPLYMYHATSTAVVASPVIVAAEDGGRWFRMNPPAYG